MKTDAESALLRRDLETLHRIWRRLPTAPATLTKYGWLRTVRESLNMTSKDLAGLLKISPSAVTLLERSEAAGTVQLRTMRRAARAMKCDLIYALVPEQSLDAVLDQQRRSVALRQLGAILPTKLGTEYRELIAAYAKLVKRNQVWRV